MRTPRMWLALSIAGVIALAGCSAGDDADSTSGGSWSDADAPSEDGYVNEEPGVGDDAGGGLDNDTGWEAEAPPVRDEPTDVDDEVADDGIDALDESGMVFVTTAMVGLQVDQPYRALDEISTYAQAHEGGTVFRDYTAATEYEGAHGIITVLLPPREMNSAVDHLSTLGEVKRLEEYREDITVRVTNLEARIRIAQMSLDRAEQWFAAATTRQEEMELESLLNERILALNELQSQQAVDSHDTALSTLTVEVYSPEAAPPEPEPEPETGFLAGLERGWNNFYSWGSDVLQVLGVLLPWLVFLGLLIVAAYFIAKPIRRWQDRRPPRPARPAGPGASAGQAGPMATMPPTGQRVVYQTTPPQARPGQPGPVAQPPGEGRTTLSQLLDTPEAPAAQPKQSDPPTPPA